MGTKYEVSHLRNIAVARLQYIYPSDLSEFQSHYFERQRELSLSRSFTIAAISLARTCNVPSILPLCFLANTWMTASHTLANRILCSGRIYKAPDGTVYTVSSEDSDLCLAGAWKFAEHRHWVFQVTFTTHTAGQDESCGRALLHRVVDDKRQVTTDTPSMPGTHLFTKRFLRPFGLCAKCTSEVELAWKEAISAMWEALPSYFNLPPWQELLAVE
jgi:hypothetical protein